MLDSKNQKSTRKVHRVVAAASDGACSGNPGPGGWGALIRFENGSVEEFGGHELETTNNRMELQAALEIFKRIKDLPRHPNLTIRTDSKYLIDGLSKWIITWKQKGWITAAGKPVMNKDLWEELDSAQLQDVPLEYVKGHSGDTDNERVDRIAVSYSKGINIELKSKQKSNSNQVNPVAKVNESSNLNEIAPKNIQKLFSRLEIATEIAKHEYALTLEEIAQLLDIKAEEIEDHKTPWKWRNWIIEPVDNVLWKLRIISGQKIIKSKGLNKK